MIIYVQKVIFGRTTQNYSSEPHKNIIFLCYFHKLAQK